jgi:hypothetical protein
MMDEKAAQLTMVKVFESKEAFRRLIGNQECYKKKFSLADLND